ncbi:MAG: lipoate--protein ligase family protein [Bacteroidales bacterium]|nr:lipoate--protein ligase family protein [Bacteroidales bacterium]
MRHVIFPDNRCRSLAFYLAAEDYVARNVDGECFFVWRVQPTVIIGRNQVLENEVNMDYCLKAGVQIVRRKSGGGCVYSDMGNLMISYISGRGEVSAVFDRYMSALAASLCSIGLPAVASERNDIMVDGRKVSGNAFHQLPDRSIVHGTLLYSTDLDALTEAIRPPVEKLQRHGVESVRQRVVNLSDYKDVSPVLASAESLENHLVSWFTDGEITLTPGQMAAIEEIEKEYQIY